MSDHQIEMSKMKKAGPLLAHPKLAGHIPEFTWYDPSSVIKMLKQYGQLYLKPDKGYQGKGIVRLKLVGDSECEIRYREEAHTVSLSNLTTELQEFIDARVSYIMQQGINLATHQGCPLDIRVVMQRPYSTWQLTLTSAKVALKEDAIVTNVSRGAKDYPLRDILAEHDQGHDPVLVMRELIDLAHQAATALGNRFSFRIIGFDMALDQEGKLWILEANSLPQCGKCKLVNDQSSVRKYEEAREVIGPLRSRGGEKSNQGIRMHRKPGKKQSSARVK